MKPMRCTLPPRGGRISGWAVLCVLTGLLRAAATVCAAEAPLPVFVSILPQAGFVAEIGGAEVTVSVLVGPGHSPATYEPTPRQMAALEGARLFLSAGVPFERGLLPKIAASPRAPLIVGLRPPAGAPGAIADHDHGHDHDHGDGIDPHTWLDPRQAIAMADTICLHLGRLRPAAAPGFTARRDKLVARLQALDAELATTLAPVAGRQFFVFHPAYGHFARRYGLVQVAVEEGGHEPGAKQLAAVIDQAKAAGARAIVVQPQFSRRSAETIARATGAEILVLDPLAQDYEANLRRIAAALLAALRDQP